MESLRLVLLRLRGLLQILLRRGSGSTENVYILKAFFASMITCLAGKYGLKCGFFLLQIVTPSGKQLLKQS